MTEEKESQASCDLKDFEVKICRPEKTGIIFLGKEMKDMDSILAALDKLQGTLDIKIGVLDMSDKTCEELSTKYKIDLEATQLVVFEKCEKRGAISLEEGFDEAQVQRLREILAKPEPECKECNIAAGLGIAESICRDHGLDSGELDKMLENPDAYTMSQAQEAVERIAGRVEGKAGELLRGTLELMRR